MAPQANTCGFTCLNRGLRTALDKEGRGERREMRDPRNSKDALRILWRGKDARPKTWPLIGETTIRVGVLEMLRRW